MRLQGRNAIITGASTGIGLGIAHRFAQEGASLVVAGLAEAETSEIADKLSRDHGAKVVAFAGDLSVRENAESLIAKAVTELGRVDILVNNAGGGLILPTPDHNEETVKRTVNNNLFTTLWCTLAAIPHMVE